MLTPPPPPPYAAEDAVLAAARQWPADGIPDNPRGRLIRVASRRAEDTDWPQILALYDLLVGVAPAGDPMASLGRAVAVAMVHGPAAGLAAADELAGALAGHHRLAAVRAHLLERAGDRDAARAAYQEAAAGTLSAPEQRCLRLRAARLGQGRPG
ncbi:hypothetical protein AB0J38_12535 [Streptomyces sp. NPDC050095]|uniref:hypothetical protein n=1 Tax=unclassified Streptomyces TaxID=2593676 RepID=UPI003438FFFC